jgi:hypothetical protein
VHEEEAGVIDTEREPPRERYRGEVRLHRSSAAAAAAAACTKQKNAMSARVKRRRLWASTSQVGRGAGMRRTVRGEKGRAASLTSKGYRSVPSVRPGVSMNSMSGKLRLDEVENSVVRCSTTPFIPATAERCGRAQAVCRRRLSSAVRDRRGEVWNHQTVK